MSDTPSGAYVIDEDYTIVNFNDTIKRLYPQLEVGEKCHRRLMGLDEPCPPCPVANHVFGPRTDDELHKLLEQIRDTGAKVLLDDFGSGYSSLGMVGSYPLDVVKTGKSFVDEIEDTATVRAVIASTIEMCHRIDMKTVAEGVETRAARGRPLQPGRPDRPLGAVHPGVPPRRLHDGVRQRAHAHGLEPSRAALPGQTLLRVHARSRRPLRPLPDEPDGRRGEKTVEVDDGDHVFQLKARYATWNGRRVFIEYGRDVTDIERLAGLVAFRRPCHIGAADAPARYNGTMNEIEVPHKAQHIIDLLEAAGFEAFVVGGCVRDAIMGRTPNDWDLTTSARPAQIEQVMADAGLTTLATGVKYGTVTVRVEHESFETTTFRADGPYSDGRHPDSVELLEHIDGDLARRDFTVNAMAYNPKTGIVDLHGGQDDLSRRVLRAVGDPHTRFDEDALRILRGMRFSSVLGFAIEPKTAAAMHADRLLLERVSAERIWAELAKLLCGPDAVRILREYRDVIAVPIPELEPEFDFDQHNPFHAYDVWEHTLHALAAAKPDASAPMRLGLLLHDIGKPHCLTIDESGRGHMYGHEKVGESIARGVCRRLRLSRAATDEVTSIVRWHMFTIPDTPRSMRRFLLKHGPELSQELFAVRRCDKVGLGREQPEDSPLNVAFAKAEALMEEQLAAAPVFGVKNLAVGGADLMELGLAEGPGIGQMLGRLLEAVVDGEVANERQPLLDYARRLLD